MSVDDQLFKDDGTLLTRVDIIILKFARLIADFLFAEEDDETCDRALRRSTRTGMVIMGIGMGIGMVIAAGRQGWGVLLVLAVVSLVWGRFVWSISAFGRCTGVGSRVSSFVKALSLLMLLWPFASMAKELPSQIAVGEMTGAISDAIFGLGMFLFYLSWLYISRLSNKPPKKKRAWAFKFALGRQ